MHRAGPLARHGRARRRPLPGEGRVAEAGPGMVLTVEPGTYIRPADNVPEAFWNIGVRIEDDVLVTATGIENLTPRRRRRLPTSRRPAAGRADGGIRALASDSEADAARPCHRRRGSRRRDAGARRSPTPASTSPSSTRARRRTAPRGDRTLALSHGARLIFERLGVWPPAGGRPAAVTPITRSTFRRPAASASRCSTRPSTALPALGYVVSLSRAAGGARRRARARRVRRALRRRRSRRSAARRRTPRRRLRAATPTACIGAARPPCADGTGDTVAGIARERRDYGQVALSPRSGPTAPQGGLRLRTLHAGRADGAAARGRRYGLVWTTTPDAGTSAARAATIRISWPSSRGISAAHAGRFTRVAERRTFPLALEFARPTGRARACVVIGNAAQALHPIAGQGFNLGLRDAYELAHAIVDAPRDALGDARMLAALFARRGAPTAVGHRVHARARPSVRQRTSVRPLAARHRARAARRAAAGEACVHARDVVRRALSRTRASAQRHARRAYKCVRRPSARCRAK